MPTTLSNYLSGYSDINNGTNIQFKVGYQAALNQMIAIGNAEEGTFYLTSDTHKLYIGRKSSSIYRTDAGHTTEFKVIPEQVSRGVTVVGTSTELPTPTADAPTGAVEEGELFYITDTNVLAALREKKNNGVSYNPKQYEWVQINPPTGITTIEGNATRQTGNTTDVVINAKISTDAGDQYLKTNFVAGNNVVLTPGTLNSSGQPVANSSQATINGVKAGVMTISAVDTLYTIGTEETETPQGGGIGNGAILELRTNGSDSDSNNTTVNITGDNTVAVVSDDNGNISVKGPTLSAVTVGARAHAAGDGFLIGLSATNGQGTSLSVTQGVLNPTIKYGQSGTTASDGVKFDSGVATLNIYTKGETDSAIDNAIKSQLSTANAMTYCGTVSNYIDDNNSSNNKTFQQVLLEKVIANGGAHNGDTYKITGLDGPITIDGVTADVGDLIIFGGTEATTGAFAGQILIGGTGVSGTPGNYTATNAYTANGLLSACDLVPSGDEPELEAVLSPQTGNSTPTSIQLRDGKNGATTNILTTTFQGIAPAGTSGNPASKILVTSATEEIGSGKKINVKIAHATTLRDNATNGDKNSLALSANGTEGTDTLSTQQYTFYVLKNGYSDLKTDVYGHVTGLQTAPITISHNTVTKLTASYGTGANSGLIIIDRNDKIGSSLADGDKAKIKLTSSTLSLTGNNTAGSQQLSIDLVWQTF